MAENNQWGQVAGAAVQAMGNYAVSVAANRKQFKYQKEAMQLQDQYNRDLWDYQNAYNTPAAQMERLQAAGLNPRLIYGSGASGGNAGPIESLEVPSRQAAQAQVPDLAGRYLSSRQMDMQYAATTQNIENAKKRGALMEAQTALENLKLIRENSRSKNFKDLAQAEVDTQKFIALRMGELFYNEKTKGDLMDQMSDIRKKQLTSMELDNVFKKHRNILSEKGIYSSDHPAFRMLLQGADRMGMDLDDLLKMGWSKIKYLFE